MSLENKQLLCVLRILPGDALLIGGVRVGLRLMEISGGAQSSHEGWGMHSPEGLESSKAGIHSGAAQSGVVPVHIPMRHERDAAQQGLECAMSRAHQASNEGGPDHGLGEVGVHDSAQGLEVPDEHAGLCRLQRTIVGVAGRQHRSSSLALLIAQQQLPLPLLLPQLLALALAQGVWPPLLLLLLLLLRAWRRWRRQPTNGCMRQRGLRPPSAAAACSGMQPGQLLEAVAFSPVFHVGELAVGQGALLRREVLVDDVKRRPVDVPVQSAPCLQPARRGATRIAAPRRAKLGAAKRHHHPSLPRLRGDKPDAAAELVDARALGAEDGEALLRVAAEQGVRPEDVIVARDAGNVRTKGDEARRLGRVAREVGVRSRHAGRQRIPAPPPHPVLLHLHRRVVLGAAERHVHVLAVDALEGDR